MSTATELLRQALEALKDAKEEVAEWGAHASPFFREKYDYEGSIKQYDPLIEELALFLASEPEAEPKTWQRLTDEEISDVLNVDPQWFMDGLNWKALDLLEYARDIERALGEKNAKPFKLVSWQGLNEIELRECYGSPETLNTKTLIEYGNAIEKMLKERNHPPRPESAIRKPMTEEKLEAASHWADDPNCFAAGIRFAEKHHGIGGDDNG